MGVIIDSCKRTFVCCESNDESGYKRVYPKYIESDSDIGDNDNDDEEDSENEEKDKKVKEIPQDVNDIKIKTNNLFMQRHQSAWEFYEELDELRVGNYGIVKKFV